MAGTGKGQEDEILTDFLNSNFGLKIKYIPFKGGGAVAKELAGNQVNSTVNNPSEALGFYQAGTVVPLLAFTKEPLAGVPGRADDEQEGKDFAYYMQRAVVGAPGMSADAAAYYQGVFKKVFESAEWQGYLKKYRCSRQLDRPARNEGLLEGADRLATRRCLARVAE